MAISKPRLLVCEMGAFTPAQRIRHEAATERLLKAGRRTDVDGGYLFSFEQGTVTAPELAEWVSDESRCCPAVDFHLSLPVEGPFTLRMDGGADIKQFLAAELGL